MQQKVILWFRDVTGLTGLSKATLYRLTAKGKFPAPVCLTAKLRGWRKEDIDRWLENLPSSDSTA